MWSEFNRQVTKVRGDGGQGKQKTGGMGEVNRKVRTCGIEKVVNISN